VLNSRSLDVTYVKYTMASRPLFFGTAGLADASSTTYTCFCHSGKYWKYHDVFSRCRLAITAAVSDSSGLGAGRMLEIVCLDPDQENEPLATDRISKTPTKATSARIATFIDARDNEAMMPMILSAMADASPRWRLRSAEN